LEDHGDAPASGRDIIDNLSIDVDFAARDLIESRDEAQ
jgi:hypothetical protein